MNRLHKGGLADLVVIVGPIASGKSTIANALGRRFRGAGRPVAVLDLDDVVDTIGGFVDLTPDGWQRAQIVHGELVGAWLRQDFDVIAHGPFFDPQEEQALLHARPPEIEPRRVQLLTTYEVALERVTGDPRRKVSKDPEVLRRAYDRVESLLVAAPRADWTFDTTATSWQDIVDQLFTAILTEPP
jgi:shikimate kinase